MSILTATLLFLIPVTILLLWYFVINPIVIKFTSKLEPRFDGKYVDESLSTVNTIGVALLGDGYRFDAKTFSSVKYSFFTLYFPIWPLGCYRVSTLGTQKVSRGKMVTHYKIFGTERWNAWEVVSIYLYYWSAIGAFLLFINLITTLYNEWWRFL